ncbi:hypothetical protein NCCP28_00770 [Niallia sp. NCCP-28]|nr:hypothetical protein NCCP28_00770 [Niallia sp. NCCP-28]
MIQQSVKEINSSTQKKSIQNYYWFRYTNKNIRQKWCYDDRVAETVRYVSGFL